MPLSSVRASLRSVPRLVASCGMSAGLVVPFTTAAQVDALSVVVVTAQKRSEEAVRVPAALSVISGQDLSDRGTLSAMDLGERLPNVQTDRANGLQITMRGVTSPDGTEKGDPSAAFHLDGVYLARPQSLQSSFFDLARIEVLRGPQGTLYGRNATAGVINVVSMAPQPKLSARAAVGVGDHRGRQFEGMVNVPLNPELALRVAVLRRVRDTELHNSVPSTFSPGGDSDEAAARLQLLIKPQAGWRLLLAADQAVEKGRVATRVPATQFYDLSNPLAPQPVDRGRTAQRDIALASLLEPHQQLRHQGTRAELTVPIHALDQAEFTYLWAHRTIQRDADGTQPLPVTLMPGLSVNLPVRVRWPGEYSQTSHEWRLASPVGAPGPWQWLVGLYAFDEASHGLFYSYGVPTLPPVYGWDIQRTRAQSHAAFGQLGYQLNAATRLTVGARHTRDEKSRIGDTLFQQTDTYNLLTDLRLRDQAASRGSRSTWRLAADHQLSGDVMAWAALSTGYKSGSFNDGCEAAQAGCNQPVPNDLLYYKPETVQALEVGLKSRLNAQRLQWQASTFGYRYRDLQLNTIVNNMQFTRNAARAQVRGAELEGRWGVTGADWLDVTLAWLDAKYTEFMPVAGVNWAGRQLDRAPRSSVGLGYQRMQALADGSRLEAGLGVVRSSAYVMSDTQVPAQYTQRAFHKLNARLAYVLPGERWRVTAWGRNLNDKITVTDYHPLGNVATSDGRRWGVQLEARY